MSEENTTSDSERISTDERIARTYGGGQPTAESEPEPESRPTSPNTSGTEADPASQPRPDKLTTTRDERMEELQRKTVESANSTDDEQVNRIEAATRGASSLIGGFIPGASAPSEESTERDGFLSWHAETHALGVGIGLGFFAALTGDARYLGLVVAAAVYGSRGNSALDPAILKDLRQEPAYALGGLVAGWVLGAVTHGHPVIPDLNQLFQNLGAVGL